ncbi:Uncharacterised protein [Comamonas testosteroni]|jgi:hypothetical protein|uniref:Uncharacterized protein n=1 Tax=Comamonas testosteroni TaxID=285 RepID=A0A8B4S1Y5_COMTE|nr:hypothetical protein CTATCC11996_14238 [Comamonas testosteroni ATCC 11996]RDI10134.1 hypothetical protein DFO48_106294 [Comamonas sp. AG1104]SUY76870.1 Uncharacterised protein [Comamonas testosteroni]
MRRDVNLNVPQELQRVEESLEKYGPLGSGPLEEAAMRQRRREVSAVIAERS